MFSKIAFRNIKKSMRDYMVYFLTLMLGVCIFYVFNSIEAQSAMMDINSAGGSAVQTVVTIMSVVSIFVSFVLAFLIIYANNFMIKRRKKELGIYLTLGMPQSKLSGMLVLETITIGLLSLAAGLVLGVFLSQGLAVVTAKLFEVNIVNFHFVFSQDAFIKTIMNFGVIFLVVVLFNTASISKNKLIDLLYADRKNEVLHLRKTGTTIALFILGVVLVGLSYFAAIQGGAAMILFTFGPALAVNVAGTLFLFMSISGFLLKSVQANKKVYYKGLNMFVLRQLNSKVNTTFVSMTFICTMLFLTIVILSTVTSFNSAMNAQNMKFTPYDISFTIGQTEGGAHTTVEESLPKVGIDESALFSEKHEYNIYETGVLMREIAEPWTEFLTNEDAVERVNNSTLSAVSLSDYNAMAAMQGKDPISLAENEFAIISIEEPLYDGINAYLETPRPITVNGKEMLPNAQAGILDFSLWTTRGGYMDMLLALPDEVAEGLPPTLDVYVANYAGEPKQTEQAVQSHMAEIGRFEENSGVVIRMTTKDLATSATAGLNTSMIFVGIYLGLIFLIAGAAVLALQQLSEAADNKKRYDLLKKLGTDEKMIDASIFAQVGLYFLMPLALALIHAFVGMDVMNQGIMVMGSIDVSTSAMLTAAFIALVYGGYFFATYSGCKSIIHAKYERQL